MIFKITLVVVALMMGGLHLHAQEFGVEYTSELQTGFRDIRDFNFVNLLRLNAEIPLSRSITMEAATISIAKTREEHLVDDLQTFSNIEEENLPLALAVCGMNWQIQDHHSLFFGIRNMNEDYFTSDVTSFFTNSSCGIYPTISCNYDIANYPLSSVGVHYKYDDQAFKVQASIYNSTGYNRFTGRKNVFRFTPEGDGIFALCEAEYNREGNHYFLGNALHSAERVSTSPWFYTEQQISQRLTLLAGYSHAFGHDIECHDFAGLGLHYQYVKFESGIFADYAGFASADEFATELTCKVQISPQLYIQPTCHLIYTHRNAPEHQSAFTQISLIRFGMCF